MRKITTTLLLTFAVLLGSAGVSWSVKPIKGLCLSGTKHSHTPISGRCSGAYEGGNYTTALNDWNPLSVQGNASVQYNLDVMDNKRQDDPQDYISAHMWYNIAHQLGKLRTRLNREML